MKKFRIMKDSMGEVKVPSGALYGPQTQRAVDNFPISGIPMPRRFIQALGDIKFCSAEVNQKLNKLPGSLAKPIQRAADQVAEGKYDEHFPIDVFQTGSGTSSNMNVNEVIAALANKLAAKTAKVKIHPNDHVNMSQSSNDVVPTAIKISSATSVNKDLLPAIDYLIKTVNAKAAKQDKVVKTGRTHLMDAMPVTLKQEMHGWSAQLMDSRAAICDSLKRLQSLPQGGTAVGTGVNADKRFGKLFASSISNRSGIRFTSMQNYFAGLSSQDAAVEMSGQLRLLAVVIMKISNDLRWMNSGPLAGLGEIELPALQPGSSIMPGKVNPVIPEAGAMVAAQVMGNDLSISIGGQAGNFQLNVMLPMVGYNLLQSMEILANTCRNLAGRAIKDFSVRQDNMQSALERNPILVTALNQLIGYEKGAMIAKQAYKEKRPVLDVAEEMTDLSRSALKKLLDPLKLTKGS